MKDDFQKILDLFNLEPEEKEERLEEIFKLSMEFIEKYKHVQQDGSKREKEDISKKLAILKEKISQETKALEEALSLSKKEIEALSSDESNFTKEQWNLLQQTKQALKEEQAILTKNNKQAIEETLTPKKRNKRKSRRGSSRWLKS